MAVMALGSRLAALSDYVARRSEGTQVLSSATPLGGGACQDIVRLDVLEREAPRALVLRSDATTSLPGSIGRHAEHAVIGAARRAGVPTPEARWLEADLLRPGAQAFVMDLVPGVAVGAKVLRSPSLAAARELLPEQLAGALAAIHRVTPQDLPADLTLSELGVRRGARDAPAAALAFLVRMLDLLPEPHPALELVHRWLDQHRPTPSPIVLVHGDFRMGNFLVSETGLTAVLDWEFAHLGSPAEDLGWLCVRDWRFGQLTRPAAGLTSRAAFLALYRAAGGLPLTLDELRWWEVYGNARWAAGAAWQGERVLGGGEANLELVAIPRRAAEMEWEALRLIRLAEREV